MIQDDILELIENLDIILSKKELPDNAKGYLTRSRSTMKKARKNLIRGGMDGSI